jgi:hypothetical protein
VGLWLLLLLTIVMDGRTARGQALAPLLPEEEVPLNYTTATVFLICNQSWLLAENEQNLVTLYAYYEAFGRALGPDHVAVWFWNNDPDFGDGLADDIDIDRSVRMCQELGLTPSRGPHVIVATRWDRDHLMLELNGLGSQQIQKLLESLADQILLQRLDQEALQSEAYWRTWETSFRSVASGIGDWIKKVTLSIDTKFFKVEIEGGPPT